MRFTTYWPTIKELEELETYSRWFAWYPVKIDMGRTKVWVWLEYIQRRPRFFKWLRSKPLDIRGYEYKL